MNYIVSWPSDGARAMAWLDSTVSLIPEWLQRKLRALLGLRASPRLLVAICSVQFMVLLIGLLQQLHRTECAVTVPQSGKVKHAMRSGQHDALRCTHRCTVPYRW